MSFDEKWLCVAPVDGETTLELIHEIKRLRAEIEQKNKWISLTINEINDLIGSSTFPTVAIVQAIEAKIKEKNI